ncbi:HdaA/DnaA family protein [Hwanghaeella sp.]|uniref:HdaA/DnaA family protein n=1 Tax=Hwanghaeella sp. TaxID=2605943 RepID=UPI003CCC3C98
MIGRQFPLALEFLPALGRADFLIAPCNQAAAALVDAWPDWPGPHALVYGPAACGKTHLLTAWREKSGASLLDPATLSVDGLDRVLESGVPAWALDGLEGVTDERLLFHLLNSVRERGGHLLMTARAAPARLPYALPDLTSRLAAATAVAIEPPDDDLLAGLLIKLFMDRRLAVDPDVVAYILPRIERSFAAIHEAVTALDRAGLAAKRRVTVALVRQVLFQ